VRKFEESDALDCIEDCMAFDGDQLSYVDFLEALVRVANDFPFSEEELAELVSFELKVVYFLKKFELKFKNQKETFYRRMNIPQGDDLKYQPRVVVDEDDDDDFGMDN
jgi:hypothetical protein